MIGRRIAFLKNMFVRLLGLINFMFTVDRFVQPYCREQALWTIKLRAPLVRTAGAV